MTESLLDGLWDKDDLENSQQILKKFANTSYEQKGILQRMSNSL